MRAPTSALRARSGTGPLMEVYRYAEPVKQKGLVFMDTPGFDPVSATGQIAGGSQEPRGRRVVRRLATSAGSPTSPTLAGDMYRSRLRRFA